VESRAVPEMTEESTAEATRAGGGGGRSTVMEEVESGATAAGRRGGFLPDLCRSGTVPREKQTRSG